MRIADTLFRQGHLSEDALTQAIVTGDRPAHLERCESCTRRALELSRWLDDTRAVALGVADDAFPAEKLAFQQAQIMRRLEQLDEPSRVIAFPAHAVAAPRSESGRRVAPAWLGVAAAAGLVVGVISGQMSAGVTTVATPAPAPAPAATTPVSQEPAANASIFNYDDLDRHVPGALEFMDDITPTLVQVQARSR